MTAASSNLFAARTGRQLTVGDNLAVALRSLRDAGRGREPGCEDRLNKATISSLVAELSSVAWSPTRVIGPARRTSGVVSSGRPTR